MDKYEFMTIISEQFEDIKSEEQINNIAEEMIRIIDKIKKQSIEYLKSGIL